MVFKHQLTPLSKGGQITKHAGKGSEMALSGNRNTMSKLAKNPAATMNDYAKATPMASPAGGDMPSGLGTGDWDGNPM